MATPKDELKSYFENGDIPGQEQFWAWLDSYRHSDEPIGAEATEYSNPAPTKYQVGGVPAGTTFNRIPLKELLDFILYGKEQRILTITVTPVDATVTINGSAVNPLTVYEGALVNYTVERSGYLSQAGTVKVTEDTALHITLEPDLSSTEIRFRIQTAGPNENVPIALLRTSDTQTLARIAYGDGKEETVTVPTYNGSQSWTDSEGNVHYIDNGNTFYHVYESGGEYEIVIQAGSNVSYARFCEGLTESASGYLTPTVNPYITEITSFRSDSLSNLDYTFAGLSKANVAPGFLLETPEVTTMNATFYGFGAAKEFESFPAGMLGRITRPTVLRGTFFAAGLKKVLPGLLDSFAELVSVFECFKNSKLGKGCYNGIEAGQYPAMAVGGTHDFVPVSLFWKNPRLKDISHVFNFIGEGNFGNLSSGYLAYFVVRRELFWNGKSAGNPAGTIENAFYAFAKCNRVLCEPDLLKHAPAMVHIGGLFTQTNQMQHPVGWATLIPVAAGENEVYRFAQSGGNYTAVPVSGKGLTFDLRLLFPAVSYPNIKTLTGAFTTAAIGANMGFQHPIDYTPNGAPAKLDLAISGADFLAKFPNAGPGSVDAYATLMLGQSGGTADQQLDGRNGVFYRLDQDSRIRDKAALPALVFNDAIPY